MSKEKTNPSGKIELFTNDEKAILGEACGLLNVLEEKLKLQPALDPAQLKAEVTGILTDVEKKIPADPDGRNRALDFLADWILDYTILDIEETPITDAETQAVIAAHQQVAERCFKAVKLQAELTQLHDETTDLIAGLRKQNPRRNCVAKALQNAVLEVCGEDLMLWAY